MSSEAQPMAEQLHWQGFACRHLGSPFYADLLDLMVADFEAGGPVATVLGPHEAEGSDAAYPIRLLGGVHRLVLAGGAPALEPFFPTTGGTGDALAAWPVYRGLLAARPPMVLDALRRPPQTNEVGRTASLAGGLAVVAQRFGLPIRLLEIGTSAALNLRLDRYWYEQAGASWGDRASSVQFVDLWLPGHPPFDAGAQIVERRGCDRDPIDATNDPEAAPGRAFHDAARRARHRGDAADRGRPRRRRGVGARSTRGTGARRRDRRDAFDLLAVPRRRAAPRDHQCARGRGRAHCGRRADRVAPARAERRQPLDRAPAHVLARRRRGAPGDGGLPRGAGAVARRLRRRAE
jgi:hypothetical protein